MVLQRGVIKTSRGIFWGPELSDIYWAGISYGRALDCAHRIIAVLGLLLKYDNKQIKFFSNNDILINISSVSRF